MRRIDRHRRGRRVRGGRADEALARVVAGRVAEDRRQDERLRLRRRLTRLGAFSVVALVLLAVGVMFLHLREPPIDAAVDSTALSGGQTVWLADLQPAKPPYMIASLTSLVLARDYERDAGDDGGQRVEVVVPVPAADCEQITALVGGVCGDGPVPRPRSLGNLSLTFSKPVLVNGSSDDARNLWLQAPQLELPNAAPATWMLDVAGPAVILTLRCFDGSTLTVLGSGLPTTGAECADGATAMRIPVGFAHSAEVELGGVRTLHLDAHARSAGIVAEDALLRVGDSHTPIESQRGTPLSIRSSEPAGTGLSLDVTTVPARSGVALDAPAAASVREAGDEMVPNLLSRHQELWLAAVFMLLALIATLWSDAFVLWR